MAYNNAWANHRLLSACSTLSQKEFEAGRTGFFPSIQPTLNHILIVDRFYVDALEGHPWSGGLDEFCAVPDAVRVKSAGCWKSLRGISSQCL
jgi:uncharacterized damage-inducible protein DinB